MNPVRIHEGRGHSLGAIHDGTTFVILCNASITPIFSGRKAKINLQMTPKLTVVMSISFLLLCTDPEIFVRGGGGGGGGGPRQSDKITLTTLFFFFFFFFLGGGVLFLSPQLILQKSNG